MLQLEFANASLTRPNSSAGDSGGEGGCALPGSNGHSRLWSMNFREILVHEVLATLHIDLAEDLVSVIDLYMYGITQPFSLHEREENLQILSLSRKITDILRPCNPEKRCKAGENALEMLVGRRLCGFDICDENYAEAGNLNPCEIMTNQGSIFLLPETFVNWWLNLDNKCIELPARYGFNHRIEDARMILRPKGPYLQLLLSRCDSEGSRRCPNLDFACECVQDDNASFTEDSLGIELLKSWDSRQENTMVFIPENRQSLILEDRSSGIPEQLVLQENSSKFISDNRSDHKMGPWFNLDDSISPSNISSRDITPEPNNGDLSSDLQHVWTSYNRGRARESHLTSVSAKFYILELGARSAPNLKR